jgi:hypothetical protein
MTKPPARTASEGPKRPRFTKKRAQELHYLVAVLNRQHIIDFYFNSRGGKNRARRAFDYIEAMVEWKSKKPKKARKSP